MANSQNFSEQSGLPKKSGGGCLKALGIGCFSIFFLFAVVPFVSFGLGSSGAGLISIVAVVTVVVLLIVLSRRNAKRAFENRAETTATPTYLAHQVDHSYETSDFIVSPACQHRFHLNELADKKKVTCVCGRVYETADLLEYKRLSDSIADASLQLQKVRYKLSMAPSPETTGAQLSTAKTLIAPKPATAKPVKTKVNLSLQQWLIIGASVLVLVAGSVFVSTNVNTLPQWAFEVVTIGVAAATGFGAFKARSISVLLANFLAAFSSSMQLATMSIVGDQISPEFEWNTMPAWWWAVSLAVISGLATILAKLSRNFGWKGLALLGSATMFTVIDLGILKPAIDQSLEHSAFPLHLALLSAAAALILAQNRFVRAIPQPVFTDPAMEEYAKDLAAREDNSLRIFGQIAAGLQLIVGAGVATGLVFSNPVPFQVLPTLAVAAVWAVLALGKKFWADQVSKSDASELVNSVSTGAVFISVLLAAISASAQMPSLLGSSLLAIVAMTALTVLSPFAGILRPSSVMTVAGLWTGAVAWLEWRVLTQGAMIQFGVVGLFVVLFGLLLAVSDLQLNSNRNRIAAPIVNGLGLLLFAIDLKNNLDFRFGSITFALVAVVIVAAANAHLPLRWFISRKQNLAETENQSWISLVSAALIVVALQLPFGSGSGDATTNAQVTLSLAFMSYAVMAQCLAIWSPLKRNFERYLVANNYLGQSVTVLGILIGVSQHHSNASTNALLIGCLAVVNYTFGTFNRSVVKMQLGYSAALISFLIYQWSIDGQLRFSGHGLDLGHSDFVARFAAQLAFVAVVTWLHTWFLRRRTECGESTLVVTPLIAVGGSMFAGVAALSYSMANTTVVDLIWAVIALGGFALASVLLSRFGKLSTIPSRSQALGWLAVEYASFAALANLVQNSDQTFAQVHIKWLISSVVLAAVLHLKNPKQSNVILVIWFYLTNLLTAWGAAEVTAEWLQTSDAPEPYSVWFAASVAISTLFAGKKFGWLRRALLIDVPLLGAALISVMYALGHDTTLIQNQLREVLAAGAVTALAYWRVQRSRPLPWIVVSYVAAAGSALALARMIEVHAIKNFQGPEISSILVLVSVLATHRIALPKLNLKSTLFSWGLPIGVALIPSTLFTYTALNTPFEQLDGGQITRVLVVLSVSSALLVHGARFGNLANASMGIAGLGLLVIPNTAFHSNSVVPGSQVESTSLVIGVLLFIALALLGKYSKIHGNSLLFIGLPIVIVLAPALVESLIALGNPTLTSVDWWRFGIVLSASMTLLIVGTLREVAGMFYPGLLSVLLSALPYGFNQTQQQSWFLWVLLLLVAGVMVWLAVHLEKMKKAGRTSAVWLKELK